jgi:hypothetical protein
MKYKLTNNTKQIGEITLYQIQALKDFNDVKKGDLGGWIEKEDNLSQDGDCWVYEEACVFENARVYGEAWISEEARVFGDTYIYEEARVYGEAWISEEACVFGDARLSGNYNYTQGWFIGGDDTGKITNITDKTGSDYWKSQYVLGDYKIEEKEEPKTEEVIGIFKDLQEVVDTFYKDINKIIK